MEIDRIKISDAINKLKDPITICDIMSELGLELCNENKLKVKMILEDFVNRKWLENSTNLYFRTFEVFRI
jgi:hypothetical protein